VTLPSKPAPRLDLGAFKPAAPGLHLVATPIGNLGDITLRALKVLGEADAVYCEDTRLTRRLMERYGLTTRLHAYHDHNAEKVRPAILARLGMGETIALVSDAGTPLISDPGYKLVRAAIEAGIDVTTLPGASSVLSALVLSGLPADRFLFLGFLPPKQSARRSALGEIRSVRASLVLFEAPQRLPATLVDLAAILGNRQGAVARELTKLHETVRRGRLEALAEEFATSPKGEVVIIVGPPEETPAPEEDIDALLEEALTRESLKTAVAEVTARLGLPRAQVYARALVLSDRKGRGPK
jgi:16S rRNA (cytidine1402-2'-O)-methyltransferase